MNNRAILIILDGWGIGNKSKGDIINQANTPNMDKLTKEYPNSQLFTDGENVGLPNGQMGNSEVGHLNIGAGRIVYQDLVRINKACDSNSIKEKSELVKAFAYARENNRSVHLIGLIGHGGVHAMSKHLYKLCDITGEYGLKKVYIHALTDGRDTDPRSGLGFVRELQEHLRNSNGVVASLTGRYYTMDRDKRWERIKKGYDLMVHGIGKKSKDVLQAIKESYNEGVTDEFIKPIVIVDENNQPLGTIKDGDVVICFNFRTDRLRQVTRALTQEDFPDYGMKTMNLHYLTMTRYDDSFKGIGIIFDKEHVRMSMGEVLSRAGLKQLRIAETEKYAHVTFFFSGGREEVFDNEERILIPSPKVATYDLQPEMSAQKVKDAIVAELRKQKYDFICLNFANCDMVGHTGIYDEIWKAVETVDSCLGEVVNAAKQNEYVPMIIADHGNADNGLNEDGTPNTAHSLNPVPCVIVSDRYSKIKSGILADVAPTLLTVMDIEIPKEMEGKCLVE